MNGEWKAKAWAIFEVLMGVAAFVGAVVSDVGWWGFPISWAAASAFTEGVDRWRAASREATR